MSRTLITVVLALLVPSSLALAQAPIAPPTAPGGPMRGGGEVPATRDDLPGAWVADRSGEVVRFDASGSFDGSSLGSGTYSVNGSVVTLLAGVRPLCAYRASLVGGGDQPSLRLVPAGGGTGPRCPTGTFTREAAPASAGGGFLAGLRGARPEAPPPDKVAEAPAPPNAQMVARGSLSVAKVVSRPRNGRLAGVVAFTHPSPSGTIRLDVPFSGVANRASAIEVARASLMEAASALMSEQGR